MKERPIIFNAEMIWAILGGCKTQTRRVVDCPPDTTAIYWTENDETVPAGKYTGWVVECGAPLRLPRKCPYGQPGDTLWVREAWCRVDGKDYYRADSDSADLKHEKRVRKLCPDLAAAHPDSRWKPSIHMPRWASRFTLEITDIRVERVQDISRDDCRTEGVGLPPSPGDTKFYPDMDELRSQFANLWDSINAKRPGCSWNDNPWCWCISFERVT